MAGLDFTDPATLFFVTTFVTVPSQSISYPVLSEGFLAEEDWKMKLNLSNWSNRFAVGAQRAAGLARGVTSAGVRAPRVLGDRTYPGLCGRSAEPREKSDRRADSDR